MRMRFLENANFVNEEFRPYNNLKKEVLLLDPLFCSSIDVFHIIQIYYSMIRSLELMFANMIKFVSCAMAVQRARAFSEYEYKFRIRKDLSLVLRPNPMEFLKMFFSL